MSVSQVGAPGPVQIQSGNNTGSVTGAWNTGGSAQPRTAGDYLIAVVTAWGTTTASAISGPGGIWSQQVSILSGSGRGTVAIFAGVAAGSDAAPTFTATMTGVAANERMSCELFELTGQDGATPVVTTGSANSNTSPITITSAGNVLRSGSFGIDGILIEDSVATGTLTYTPDSHWTAVFDTGSTAARSHSAADIISNPATGATLTSAPSVTMTSGSLNGISGVLIVVQPPAPPSTAPFTAPELAPRGRPGGRGRALGPGLFSRGATIRPTPAPFVPPELAPRGRPGGRGRAVGPGLFSRGATIRPTPAPFVPPELAPRGRPGGRGRAVGPGLAGAGRVVPRPAPFVPPRLAPRGRAGRAGRAQGPGLFSVGAPIVTIKNLLIALASAAGTDDYGTAYPQGILATAGVIEGPEIIVGQSTGTQIILMASGSTGTMHFRLNNPAFTDGQLFGTIVGSFANLVWNGPANTGPGFLDFVGFEMNSSDGVSSFANLEFIYTDTTGTTHLYAFMDGTGFNITTGKITGIQPGTSPAVQETWHNVAAPSGWSGTNRYKKIAESNFIVIDVQLSGSGSGNVTCMTLPAAYSPSSNYSEPLAITTTATLPNTLRMTITTAGVVSTSALPATTTSISGTWILPLD